VGGALTPPLAWSRRSPALLIVAHCRSGTGRQSKSDGLGGSERILPVASDAPSEVLDPRELLAGPWEGEAEVWRPVWTRWVPGPRTFRFRTEIVNLAGDSWEVVDTTTFPKRGCSRATNASPAGFTRPRLARSGGHAPGRQAQPWSRRLRFEPYLLLTPVIGPLRVPLRSRDSVRLIDATTMGRHARDEAPRRVGRARDATAAGWA
jgi:hypothetical protein